MNLEEQAFELCKKIVKKNPQNFSGIGLVVYDSMLFDQHNHCNLRPDIECPHYHLDDEEIIDYWLIYQIIIIHYMMVFIWQTKKEY